jgi:hypothetical protein
MDKIIAVRMTGAELLKLDMLAKATGRDRSKILRLLLAEAKLAPRRDIRVGEVQHA